MFYFRDQQWRNFFLLALICCSLGFSSCKKGFNYSSESMARLNGELKDKFGNDAWYTSIIIRHDPQKDSDNIITVMETKDPNSLKQEQWVFRDGFWEKAANVTVQIGSGKPSDYMFRLDKAVRLSLLTKLMEQSQQKLSVDKNIKDAQFDFVSITSNNEWQNRKQSIVYTISLHSAGQDKSYSMVYNLNGALITFNE
jgi:hypothetical protein